VFGGDPRAARCASTSSATFAGTWRITSPGVAVKEGAKEGIRAGRRFAEGDLTVAGRRHPHGVTHRFRQDLAGDTPEPPAARLPVPPLSRGAKEQEALRNG